MYLVFGTGEVGMSPEPTRYLKTKSKPTQLETTKGLTSRPHDHLK
jgi:hypothetical protein